MFKLRTSSPAVVPVEKVLSTPVTAALPTPELDLVQGQLTNNDQQVSVNGKNDDSRGSPSPPPHGETKLVEAGVDGPVPPRTNILGTGDMKGTLDPASTDEQS